MPSATILHIEANIARAAQLVRQASVSADTACLWGTAEDLGTIFFELTRIQEDLLMGKGYLRNMPSA
jgi:hypothetical protein